MGVAETLETSGQVAFKRIAKVGNHIVIYPNPDASGLTLGCIALSGPGTPNEIKINLPYTHRINMLEVVQFDASLNLAVNALNIDLETDPHHSSVSPRDSSHLVHEVGNVDSSNNFKFGEGYEFAPRTWTITLEGTATNLVFFALY